MFVLKGTLSPRLPSHSAVDILDPIILCCESEREVVSFALYAIQLHPWLIPIRVGSTASILSCDYEKSYHLTKGPLGTKTR